MRKRDRGILECFADAPETQEAVAVVLHSQHQRRRGRGLAMAFDGIRNPRLALARAIAILTSSMSPCQKAKDEAMKLLTNARTSNVPYFDYTGQIRQLVDAAGCTLADIGTSETELEQLPLDILRRDAASWLEKARESSTSLVDYAEIIRQRVDEAGCTLADIGTSETELEQLLSRWRG